MKITIIFIIFLISLLFVVNQNTPNSKDRIADNSASHPINAESDQPPEVNASYVNQSMEKMVETYNNKLHKNVDISDTLSRIKNSKDLDEKQELYEDLVFEIDVARAERHITNLEALTIHLTALKFRFNEDDYDAEAEKVRQRYSQDSITQWNSYKENRDKNFLDYKKMESELLVKVKAMKDFPDGLTKMEYFEREIAKIKTIAYATDVE